MKRTAFQSLFIPAIALLMVMTAPHVASAAPGAPDPTFGAEGWVATDFAFWADQIAEIAVDSSGRIVAAGRASNRLSLTTWNWDFALARYNPDGRIDRTFGSRGKVRTHFGSGQDIGEAVAIGSDGKITVVGSAASNSFSPSQPALARYRSDGSLDPSFGSSGKVLGATQYGGELHAVRILSDGRILAAGSVRMASGSAFVLVRLLSTGNPDPSFGDGGAALADFGAGLDTGRDLVVQADGRIVVIGVSQTLDGAGRFAAARFTASGAPDPTFDGDGKVLTDFGSGFAEGYAATLQPNGRVVVAGSAGGNPALVRYTVSGALDPSFGDQGRVLVEDPAMSSAYALTSYADGRLVAAGAGLVGSGAGFSVTRMSPDGILDSAFGDDGFATLDATGGTDNALDVLLHSTGTILIGGGSTRGTDDFAVAKFSATGRPVSGFGGDGQVVFDHGSADELNDLTVDGQGRPVAVGRSNGEFVLIRRTPDGAADPSFAGIGLAVADFGRGRAWGVALQADGKIVAAGEAGVGNFGITRFGPNGTLDPQFSSDGMVVTDFGTNLDVAHSVLVQPDGKIVAAGGGDFQIQLARYLSNGSPDSAFGSQGKVIKSGGHAFAATLQADGKIVTAGNALGPTTSAFAVDRFNVDGSVDTTFGTNGRVTTDLAGDEFAYSVAVQTDGKIVIAGVGSNATGFEDNDFVLVRYTTNGSLDSSFGGDGVVVTDFAGEYDEARAVFVQPDGNVVAVGRVLGDRPVFGLARYLPNGSLDPTFGLGGRSISDFAYEDQFPQAAVADSASRIWMAGYVKYAGSSQPLYDFALGRAQG